MRAHSSNHLLTFPLLWVNQLTNRVLSARAPPPIHRSKFSSVCAQSWPRNTSLNLLYHHLPVDLRVHSIADSKYISTFDYGFGVYFEVHSITATNCISILAQLWSTGSSPKTVDQGCQVDLWVYWISASKCISKLFRSWPQGVSLCLVDLYLPVKLESLSGTACSQSRYSMFRWVAILIHRYIDT